nr:PREDICTED: queuine tRNA-ribosyltransferase subunit QTRTD1 isoform X1 [Latimeria chalumnae]XP_014343261.1 PREDICTED: queuine tRNA-ribosyltransferase subunit QTRTD1 isoform X1 [Latimeria chalumnae]|eukprot:XP_005994929.1 PREDICTED: queuine tRNA-ribosyltransferase subunit QTRTD1 isoform X1 [Latimeria chalumnae]
MKLDLIKVVNGQRLGVLTNLGKNRDKSLEIPGCLLYTRTGSAPHLTPDVLHEIEGVPSVVQLTLSTLAEHHEVLQDYKEGIGKFIGMPDSILYCSLYNPVTPPPSGYNTNKTVSVWGGGGRIEMTPSKFISMQQALQPDWYQCMADSDVMGEGVSQKRARKSVDRTLAFLDECLQLQQKSKTLNSEVIGAVEGGDVLEERLRSARETAKRPVGGFLLDNFHGDCMSREVQWKLISAVTAELPEDKPRLIHGISRPDEVLECVERGVDLFESFFPYQVTERGCALTFCYRYQPDPETAGTCSKLPSLTQGMESAVLEQNRVHNSEESGDWKDSNANETDEPQMTPFEMNLKLER